jgi:hypothetical protein
MQLRPEIVPWPTLCRAERNDPVDELHGLAAPENAPTAISRLIRGSLIKNS